MKFADFHAGQVLTAGPMSVSECEIVEFARAYDPQPFHVDAAAAARGRWGGLIASGWHTCAIAMRLACDHLLAGSESIGSPGVAYLKWPAPVRPDEPLTLRVEVLEVRRSERRPELGILRWRWQLQHADGRDALEMEATSLFELGGA
jgi:acyl dehydratase